MSATPPPDGFYWFVRNGHESEPVEISDGNLSFFGNEMRVRLDSWPDRGQVCVIKDKCRLVPLEPPTEPVSAPGASPA